MTHNTTISTKQITDVITYEIKMPVSTKDCNILQRVATRVGRKPVQITGALRSGKGTQGPPMLFMFLSF